MYADDNGDHMAQPNWDGGNSSSAPQGWLYSMNSSTLPAGAPTGSVPNPYDTPPAYWKGNFNGAIGTGLWFKYMPNYKAFLCPVDIQSQTFTTPTANGGRQNKLSTYVMDGAVIGFPGSGTWPIPCKTTDVWSPMCYLIWEPNEKAIDPTTHQPIGAFEYNDGANKPGPPEGIGTLHGKNGGLAMALDGHCDFVTISQFNQYSTVGSGPGPGGKTFVWWNPSQANGGLP
jgi:hypothetical protein